MKRAFKTRINQQGFTMIEMVVALIVMVIAKLGSCLALLLDGPV